MSTAADVMSSTVRGIIVSGTMREAVALLNHHRMSGLPVIDCEGHLHGVVSQYDCLRAYLEPDLLDRPVTELMSTESLVVQSNTPLEEVAELFLDERIHRAPVLSGDSVIGVISRTDLVRHLEEKSLITL